MSGLRRERIEFGECGWIELTEPTVGHYRRHLRPPKNADTDWGLDAPARLMTAAQGDDGMEISLPALGAGDWLRPRVAVIDSVSLADYLRLQDAAARLAAAPTGDEARQSPKRSETSEPVAPPEG